VGQVRIDEPLDGVVVGDGRAGRWLRLIGADLRWGG